MKTWLGSKTNYKGQLSLGINRDREEDRNLQEGGRSFYFFDFDDNVATLSTEIFIFHKTSREEIPLTSMEYYKIKNLVGKTGSVFENYEFDYDDSIGSFRNFRDKDLNLFHKMLGKKQSFVTDLERALAEIDLNWKAPSWDFFYHATYNQRPVSIITARGHNPQTIIDGIQQFVKHGYLPCQPNYLGVYPVSNPNVRKELGDHDMKLSVPELKKLAIKNSVYEAVSLYGESHPHRFGMSDDDPSNVQLIASAMEDLKKEFNHMSFFVINTGDGNLVKQEVLNPNAPRPTVAQTASRKKSDDQLNFQF